MIRQLLLMAALGLSAPSITSAQTTATPQETLSSCVTRSMSVNDGITTARWLFIAMSRHPDLPQAVRVGDSDTLAANRDMGALVNRMLFEFCSAETRAAIATHGQEAALEAVFSTLGETAMTHLMGNRDVLASVIQLGAYVDQERFIALAGAAD